jgi:hypothetical protein
MNKERLQEIKKFFVMSRAERMNAEGWYEISADDADWLISEVERLQAEIKDIQRKTSEYIGEESLDRQREMSSWHTSLSKSQQKVERLEKALEFYADPSNYHYYKIENGIATTKIDEDTGDIARQALETEGKE